MPADKTALKAVPLDIDWSAQTLLPIEFGGREVTLEARAYQGEDRANQAPAGAGPHQLQAGAGPHQLQRAQARITCKRAQARITCKRAQARIRQWH